MPRFTYQQKNGVWGVVGAQVVEVDFHEESQTFHFVAYNIADHLGNRQLIAGASDIISIGLSNE